jgi:hypothetical protein
MLVKRALKGRPGIIAAAKKLQDDVLAPAAAASDMSPLDAATATVAGLKQTAIMMVGLAMQTYGERLQHEQEILMLVSDVMIDAFAADSAVLRARGSAATTLYTDGACVLSHDAGLRTEAAARTALAAMAKGDTLRTMLAALRRVLKVSPVDTIAARRRIADAVLQRKGYIFA